jgi:serine/threonine protein kinase
MPDAMPMQPEQSFAHGRFVLVKRLGRGGMGEVWLALKFLPAEIPLDPAALDDLRRETARSRKLAHPNIVRIHDLHQEADGMTYSSACSIWSRLRKPPFRPRKAIWRRFG